MELLKDTQCAGSAFLGGLMALLVDNDVITLSDLIALDPEAPAIADAEGIVLEGAGSVIRQAWEECAAKLIDSIQQFGSGYTTSEQLWTGLISASRPRVQPNQIVVDNPYGLSAVRRWLAQQGLVQLYSAAANKRANDRYSEKLDAARQVLGSRWRTLWSTGLPYVASPIACPGAAHEPDAGEFTESNTASVAGGAGAEAVTYEVAITWVDGSVYISQLVKNNAESGPSKRVSCTVAANQLLRVNITGLTPPGSVAWQHGTADGIRRSRVATGWNCYVGSVGGQMYLQNATPIPIATDTYTLAAAPVLSGYRLGTGQYADANLPFQATLQRG